MVQTAPYFLFQQQQQQQQGIYWTRHCPVTLIARQEIGRIRKYHYHIKENRYQSFIRTKEKVRMYIVKVE